MGAPPRPHSASPSLSCCDPEDEDDLRCYLDARPATAAAGGFASPRPGSPLICASPLLLKFRPSTSPATLPHPKIRALKLLKNRDKESLLDEILKLKDAIGQQAAYLSKQKVYAVKLRSQNRKLEQLVDELELLGVKAPRTGAPTRLRALLEGLKAKLGGLQGTCDCQDEEIFQLSRDLRVTNSKEVQVERDVLRGERPRLQMAVKQLKRSMVKMAKDNKEMARMRDRNAMLQAGNERLELSLQAIEGNIIKAREDTQASKKIVETTIKENQQLRRICESFLAKRSKLEEQMERVRAEREKRQKRVNGLKTLIRRAEMKLIEMARSGVRIPGLTLRGGGPESEDEGVEALETSVAAATATVDQAKKLEGKLHASKAVVKQETSSKKTGKVLSSTGGSAAMDGCCQTAHEASKSRRTPPIPKLNLGIVKQQTAAPAAKQGRGASKEMHHRLVPVAARKPSVPVFRPQSRLGFVPEAETPKEDDDPATKQAKVEGLDGVSSKLCLLIQRTQQQDCEASGGRWRPSEPSTSSSSSSCCYSIQQQQRYQQQEHEHEQQEHEHEQQKLQQQGGEQEHQQRKKLSWSEPCKQQRPRLYTSSSSSFSVSSQQVWTVSSEQEARCPSRQEMECLEWIKALDVPGMPSSCSSVKKHETRSYAEDTLQLMQLSRPAYDPPGTADKLIRRQHPP